MNNKISVAIIGVQKAATSSVYNYLLQHPNVAGHAKTFEFTYFIRDEEYKLSWNKVWSNYFNRKEDEKLHLIKNAGLIFSEKAIKRLKDHNPQVKIIIILRNPVDRAYSGYMYARKNGAETNSSFDEAIITNKNNINNNEVNSLCMYLERGYYDSQLETIFNFFSRDQVKIVFYDDIIANTKEVIRELFSFISIDNSMEIDISKNYNKSSVSKFPLISKMVRSSGFKGLLKKVIPLHKGRKLKRKFLSVITVNAKHPQIDQQTRKMLVKHFKPHNEKLSAIIKKDLSFWDE